MFYTLLVLNCLLLGAQTEIQTGLANFMDDDKKATLIEIAEFLRENYVQYSRGVAYLEQLAGVRAMPRAPPARVGFLLLNQAGVQRGAVVLGNPEPHTLHTMNVRFHRYN